jgi:hypothetical protein
MREVTARGGLMVNEGKGASAQFVWRALMWNGYLCAKVLCNKLAGFNKKV